MAFTFVENGPVCDSYKGAKLSLIGLVRVAARGVPPSKRAIRDWKSRAQLSAASNGSNLLSLQRGAIATRIMKLLRVCTAAAITRFGKRA